MRKLIDKNNIFILSFIAVFSIIQIYISSYFFGSTDMYAFSTSTDMIMNYNLSTSFNYFGMYIIPNIFFWILEFFSNIYFPIIFKSFSILIFNFSIYFFCKNYYQDAKSDLLALLIIFNPYIFLVNGIWGQLDALSISLFIFSYLIIINDYQQKTNNIILASFLMAFSISLKALPIFFIPILIFYYFKINKFKTIFIFSLLTPLIIFSYHYLFHFLYDGDGPVNIISNDFLNPFRYNIGSKWDFIFENFNFPIPLGSIFLQINRIAFILISLFCITLILEKKNDFFFYAAFSFILMSLVSGPTFLPPYMFWCIIFITLTIYNLSLGIFFRSILFFKLLVLEIFGTIYAISRTLCCMKSATTYSDFNNNFTFLNSDNYRNLLEALNINWIIKYNIQFPSLLLISFLLIFYFCYKKNNIKNLVSLRIYVKK